MDSNPTRTGLIVLLVVTAAAAIGFHTLRDRPEVPEAASLDYARFHKNLAYHPEDIETLKTTDLGPNKWNIIDIHEHVIDVERAGMMVASMDKFGVAKTCLMSSSWYTFTLNRKFGFERYKENNKTLLDIKKAYPGRFCAFIMIDPLEEGNLERVQEYVDRGADGLKLYLGHGGSTGKGPFHTMALDDPRMMPIYAWAEETQLPIMMHVNLNKFGDEFERVMQAHPDLRLCLPHFGLSKNTEKRLARLSRLLTTYPNLYTEISFGWHTFQTEGFEALAKWRTRSHDFLTKHADKIMYASDMVLDKLKKPQYIDDTFRSYRQLLEADAFRYFREPFLPMHGLKLSDDTLTQIYERTPARFLRLDEPMVAQTGQTGR